MIGWFFKDLDPVSLYMDKERGLAEDFCKLWCIVKILSDAAYFLLSGIILENRQNGTSVN